jgi:hypothetical protein
MIANPKLGSWVSLATFRAALARAVGPARAMNSALQTASGPSENKRWSDFFTFGSIYALNSFGINKTVKNPRRFLSIFVHNSTLFQPQIARFWPQSSPLFFGYFAAFRSPEF